jgi:hypothetical protein
MRSLPDLVSSVLLARRTILLAEPQKLVRHHRSDIVLPRILPDAPTIPISLVPSGMGRVAFFSQRLEWCFKH